MRLNRVLTRMAEKTVDNTTELRKTRYQRRTQFTDLYGTPFSAQGDASTPASFYISISPDLVYHMKLLFKLEIKPYEMTVKGGTSSTTVNVNNRSLSVSGSSVIPNPHDHSTDAHSHNLISGKTMEHTTSSTFRISVNGVPITAYLMAQQDGEWIDGEGLYPNNKLEGEENFYDLLAVANLMYNEGRYEDCEKLLKGGEMKKVEISSDAPFGVTMYLYEKLNNVGR